MLRCIENARAGDAGARVGTTGRLSTCCIPLGPETQHLPGSDVQRVTNAIGAGLLKGHIASRTSPRGRRAGVRSRAAPWPDLALPAGRGRWWRADAAVRIDEQRDPRSSRQHLCQSARRRPHHGRWENQQLRAGTHSARQNVRLRRERRQPVGARRAHVQP